MAAPIKHLKPADYRVMPWKNGAGSTTEIAVEALPAGGFLWRVSMADLVQSGPFSVFSGVDRIITPIAGPAFRLRHAGRGDQVVTPFVPYAFSGDWTTEAKLEGPGKDYNVMVRRDAGSAWTEVLAPAEGFRRTYPKGKVIVTALAPATLAVDTESFQLKAYESLILSGPVVASGKAAGMLILSAIVI